MRDRAAEGEGCRRWKRRSHWRARQAARGNETALSPSVSRLARVYALMIYYRQDRVAEERLEPAVLALIDAWRRDAGGIQGDSHA